MFETLQSRTQPLGAVGVHPPRLGWPVALVGLLSPRPLPRHTQSCRIGKEESFGKSQQIELV